MMVEPNHEAIGRALGALIRDDVDRRTARFDASSRARVLLQLEAKASRSRPGVPWRALVLSPLAVVLSLALFFAWRQPTTPTYVVLGAKTDGPYISAPDDRAVTVHFSDATTLEVAAQSRLRIDAESQHGTRVLLERGEASVRVTHREGTRWTFSAGPFDVLVTGTRFDLGWDPSNEVFDLRLHEGSVEIRTPFVTAPVHLEGGQSFHARMRDRSMTTAKTKPTEPGDASAAQLGAEPPRAPLEDDSGAAGASSDETPAPAPGESDAGAATPAPAPKRWSALVASGQFAAVLTAVEEQGIEHCVRACSASDLRAVADAARYRGRQDLAIRSLRALVTRFPQDSSGREATFWLGRSLERQGNASEARGWYERYRSLAPRGSYSAEALAGAMRTTLTSAGREAARPMAQEYLARYPAGADTATARGIVGAP